MGHEVVSGQLHGMAQRGGSVQSSITIDGGACSQIAEGELDYLVGFEPIETARARSLLHSKSIVIMNSQKILPFVLAQEKVSQSSAKSELAGEYPDLGLLRESLEEITPYVYLIDGSDIAARYGSKKALNMVLLGALLSFPEFKPKLDFYWQQLAAALSERMREQSALPFLKGNQKMSELIEGANL